MNKPTYQKIKRLLKKAERELEEDVLKEGGDITSNEFERALLEIKKVILREGGFSIDEYNYWEKEPEREQIEKTKQTKQEKEEFSRNLALFE